VPVRSDPARSRKIIRLIAVERIVRGVLLVVGGIYLVTHLHSNFGRSAEHLARAIELDPRRPFLQHIFRRLHHLHAGTVLITGLGAIGYGVLESIEGWGLWHDRLWAEFLTVIATGVLLPLEMFELIHKASVLKAVGIAANIAIVAYLAYRLRRRLRSL